MPEAPPRRPVISNTADIGSGIARSLCQNPPTIHCVFVHPPSRHPTQASAPQDKSAPPRQPSDTVIEAIDMMTTEVGLPTF